MKAGGRGGAAYVFDRIAAGEWSQPVRLSDEPPHGWFGWSVAISGDTLVVGAPLETTNADGDVVLAQSGNSLGFGAAYVYVREGADWSLQAKLKASNAEAGDSFGYEVAVHEDLVMVGATWERSEATGVDGNQLDNSVRNAGAAYAFAHDGTTWRQAAYLKAAETFEGAFFGHAVAASDSRVRAAGGGADSFALATYYTMREVLRQSAAGEGLIALYEDHSPELSRLLFQSLHLPGFLEEGIAVLSDFQSGYARLLAGDGDGETISQEMIDRVNRVADRFAALGSEALREAIEIERARFNHLQDFEGRSFGDWARMLGVHVPESPWLVVSSARRLENGASYFEVNHVPGHAYSVWRTSDLESPDWREVDGVSFEVVGHSVRVLLPRDTNPMDYYRVRADTVVSPR